MSSYCRDCSLKANQRTGDKACPFNYLYWNFLISNQDRLRSNSRMALTLNNLDKISKNEQKDIQVQSQRFIKQLTSQGNSLASREE